MIKPESGGEWLTVKEFAAAAGVSTQAVYKQICNRFATYCKEENGRKYIHSDALEMLNGATGLQPSCQPFATELQALQERLADAEKAAAVAAAERDAERRRADAAETREAQQAQTVNALTAALQTAQQQAADLTAALTAAQALHAGTIQERLAVQDGAQIAPEQTENQTEKRGLFHRIFRRRGG